MTEPHDEVPALQAPLPPQETIYHEFGWRVDHINDEVVLRMFTPIGGALNFRFGKEHAAECGRALQHTPIPIAKVMPDLPPPPGKK